MRTLRVVCSIGARGASMLVRSTNGWQPSSTLPSRYRCAVVTDLIDESYLSLDVPKMGASDRRGFIDMQLQNRFPDTALRASLPYRAKEHPGRVMLTGVGNPLAEKTIADLAESPAELLGVWSLPTLLMGTLAKHLRKLPPAFFAMLPTPDGLRLLVVIDGVPVLTRLLPLNNTGKQNQDVVATRRYLEDGRMIARGTPLSILALDCPADQINALAESGFKMLAPPWRPAKGGSEYDRLLDLAFSGLPGQLAPNRMRERFRLRIVHKVMIATTAVGVSAAAFAALEKGQRSLEIWGRISDVRAEAELQKSKAERAQQELQQLGVDAELLLAARKLESEALRHSPDPLPMLQQVSRLTAAVPQWRLTRLEWQRMPLAEACRQTKAPGDDGGASGPAVAAAMSSPADSPMPVADAGAGSQPGATGAAAAVKPAPPKDILELRLSFEAPEAESPMVGTQRRDKLVRQLKTWQQAEMRRGGEKTNNVSPLIGTARKSADALKNTEVQQYCLALRDPATRHR